MMAESDNADMEMTLALLSETDAVMETETEPKPTIVPKRRLSILKAAGEQHRLEQSATVSTAFHDVVAEVAIEQGMEETITTGSDAAKERFKIRRQTADDAAFLLMDDMGIDPTTLQAPDAANAIDDATDALLIATGIDPSLVDENTNAMFTEMGIKPPNQSDADPDMSALFASMGIENPGTDPNVDALAIDIGASDANANALFSQILGSKSASRYGNRKYNRTSQSRDLGRTSRYSVDSEPSKIAKLLRNSESEEWAQQLDSHFSCATERDLFRNMYKTQPHFHSSNSTPRHHRTRNTTHQSQDSMNYSIDRLSKPKTKTLKKEALAFKVLEITARGNKVAINKKHAIEDDQRNCTFRPRTIKSGSLEGNHQNDEEDEAKSNFLERQEAYYREHLTELETDRGKLDYDAKIDKKYCPNCHAKQSYDEVKEKRKLCPNCNVEYKPKIAWGSVKKGFTNRQSNYLKKIKEKEEKLLQELEYDKSLVTRPRYDKKSHKIVVDKVDAEFPVWTEEVEQDFFDRYYDKLEEKKIRLKELEESIYKDRSTFTPTLTTKKKSNEMFGVILVDDEEDDDGELDRDPVEEFERRMLLDLWRRRKNQREREEIREQHGGDRSRRSTSPQETQHRSEGERRYFSLK